MLPETVALHRMGRWELAALHEVEFVLSFASKPNCPPPHYHAFDSGFVLTTNGRATLAFWSGRLPTRRD